MEAIVRLLEEGLDRLKISVNVIGVSSDLPQQGPTLADEESNTVTTEAAICDANLPTVPSGPATTVSPHPRSSDPETAGLTAPPVAPATTAPNITTTAGNRSSFHRLNEIIKVLTKKAKAGACPEDLISITLLSDYNILRKHLHVEGDPTPDKTASLRIASCKPSQWKNHLTKGPWFARRLREMANHVLTHQQLPERRQGKGGKHASLLDQRGVRTAVEKFMNDCEPRTMCSRSDQPLMFSCSDLYRSLHASFGEAILDSQKISLSTAERWLQKLGYQLRVHRKDIYMDGHEREDVVVARKAFLERVKVLEG